MNFPDLKPVALAGALAIVSAISSVPAIALPLVQNGAIFAATATALDVNTASFQVTADVRDLRWLGSGGPDEFFAVSLKLPGYVIDSIDAFSTNAAGTWLPVSKKTRVNECLSGSDTSFGCTWSNPFDAATGVLNQGLLTWDFTVSFTEDLGLDTLLAEDNRLGIFFRRCRFTPNLHDGNARLCSRGSARIQNVSFNPGPNPDSTQVPLPGTLLLLGLGMLGLARSRRRR